MALPVAFLVSSQRNRYTLSDFIFEHTCRKLGNVAVSLYLLSEVSTVTMVSGSITLLEARVPSVVCMSIEAKMFCAYWEETMACINTPVTKLVRFKR